MSTNGKRPSSGAVDLRERLAALLPGDQVVFSSERRSTVRTILHGREQIDAASTEWRWIWLADGSLLERAPKGCYRYDRHLVVEQGTALYEELVAQDGALVRFERRVRAGTVGRRHIRVTLERTTYRVAFTGTVAIQRFGYDPELGPWRSFAADPAQNVYFGLVDLADRDSAVLGLWTTDVSLSFGRPLQPAELLAIEPGEADEQP